MLDCTQILGSGKEVRCRLLPEWCDLRAYPLARLDLAAAMPYAHSIPASGVGREYLFYLFSRDKKDKHLVLM